MTTNQDFHIVPSMQNTVASATEVRLIVDI